jgi:YtfJ family uncharacterized protein
VKYFIICIFISFFLVQYVSASDLEIGKVPPTIELKEKMGGRLDGSPWSSDELKGKIHVLFYVDPDEKDLNNDASEALSDAEFSPDYFQSLAIINMAATWLPNFAISSSLKEKQKKYPNTLYLRDYKKVVVEKWGLADDNSDVVAFDRQGRLIFRKDGKLDESDIEELLNAIKSNI